MRARRSRSKRARGLLAAAGAGLGSTRDEQHEQYASVRELCLHMQVVRAQAKNPTYSNCATM
eukprot:3677370-Heterocapsa_arctica.AAC.1